MTVRKKPEPQAREDAEKMMLQHVQDVFVQGKTTEAERLEICRQWTDGDSQCYMQLAEDRGLLPIAVICAAVIDAEHPVLCPEGRLTTRSIVGLAALVLRVEYTRLVLSVRMSSSLTNELLKFMLDGQGQPNPIR